MDSPRRAVFLDRDGVINRAFIRNGLPYGPDVPEELEILPGVREALARLRDAGFYLVVVTNQPDVARGTRTREAVEDMNTGLLETLPLDDIRACYHDDRDHCTCRKPKPGLLQDAAREAGLDLSRSFMVGDRWRDVDAGRNAGCITIFVDGDYSERRPDSPDATVRSLPEAADWILSHSSPP